MALQYIVVRFPETRDVFVDGKVAGRTEITLRVGEGTHTIHLGEPRNYTPKWRRPNVTGTNPILPMQITFERDDG